MNYPFEIKDIQDEGELKKLYNLYELVTVGPKNYVYPKLDGVEEHISTIYNMEVRPSDVFVVTVPRSGTTMTQELVWLIVNDLDYETAKKVHLSQRYCGFTQYHRLYFEKTIAEIQDEDRKAKLRRFITPLEDLISSLSDPRFFKSHYPLSLLNPDTLRTSRVVYVARNPLDVAVSSYHFYRMVKRTKKEADFKLFWEFFKKGLIYRGPYFDHVLEAWEQREHPNMLFLFYENIVNDLRTEIYKICNFFNKSYSEEQIDELCTHLQFNNFKKNKSVNWDFMKEDFEKAENSDFVRKGKVGGWRDYFDDAMCRDARQWLQQNLEGTTLKFPEY